MRHRRVLVRVGTAALLAALAFSPGCTKKIWIVQVPDFYTPELKTVAVVPFRNQTAQRGADNIIADKVAASLVANGTYKVFNRNDLRALMDANDLKIALGSDAGAAAASFKKLTNVQAILVGTVTTYAASSQSQRKRDPIYAYDKKGNQYIQGYREYVHTRNEGNVYVTASLIAVSDGTTIHATAEPAWARVWAEGSPPNKDPHACVSEATDNVVSQLVAEFAPVRRQIKIDVGKALRTASELYDNKWTYTDRFKATDDKMYVVVSLPPSCDRNKFRLVIVPKDRRTDVATRDIVWSKKYGAFGYDFSPKQIAAKEGPGQYEVKFYSGQEPVLRCPFWIR